MDSTAYNRLIDKNPTLKGIVNEDLWNFIGACGKATAAGLNAQWEKNIRANVDKHYKKHGSVARSFYGFGKDKAVIMVGAGPSFNLNKDHLLEVFNYNSRFPLHEQPFIIMASNHQYKPLLKMGIVPHFVVLTDGGGHVYDQLCKGIKKQHRKMVMIASLYADHRIITDWIKQGGEVVFFISQNPYFIELFETLTGEDAHPVSVGSGGNVMNSAFSVSIKQLLSKVFMVTGCDLSYPYDPDTDKRREFFYADKDYSTNIGRGVDEAKDEHLWLGIDMRDNPFQDGHKIIDLKQVSTSKQLFVYKTWIETHAVAWADDERPFHFYNCSEAGIAGVLAHSVNPEAMKEKDNWYLIDELIPKRWKTRSLVQATTEYLRARLICQMEKMKEYDAGNVIGSGEQMDFVKHIDPTPQLII